MTFNPLAAAARAAARLRNALIDPARRERAMLLSLAAYVVVWTAYGTIEKSSQGLHADMTELVAWSRDLAWGYKHPPLAAAVVRLWFSVFPLAEWSYYLLAMLMPALALWIVWRLAADYLDPGKRLAAVPLLMFVPFFNFHALKFNVNTLLLPLWAATAFFFLRSYRTHGLLYAALAGAFAAAAMLGKYWSVFLIAGFALAALIDRRRGAYFRSPAPWITMAVGALVIAPHIWWLFRNQFEPFSYAVAVHGDHGFANVAVSVLGYLGGSMAYVAIPVIVVLIAARPNMRTLADTMWPADDARRLAATAFWGPLLLPVPVALISSTEITSLWSMSAWTLLPILLLSPEGVALREIDTRRLTAAAVVLPLAALVAAPFIAINVQRHGPPPASAQGALLAAELERLWHQATPEPLRFVAGELDLADAVATYAVDRPRVLTAMPAPDPAELVRGGKAIVCFAEDTGCQSQAPAGATRVVTDIVRNFLRVPGRPQRYTIFIVPPR
jgi:4-amino-4-deoxy-L-arabinose transferase-like glycosyltransferase